MVIWTPEWLYKTLLKTADQDKFDDDNWYINNNVISLSIHDG